MSASQVFSIANVLVLPMWLLMLILPKWKVTEWLISFKLIPLVLAVVYAFYIISSMISGGGMDFSSLESVMALFTVEDSVLAGWVHYLAFDLLVGMWMINKNKEVRIHGLLMVPCLICTFMLGPIGFLLFTIISSIKKQLS